MTVSKNKLFPIVLTILIIVIIIYLIATIKQPYVKCNKTKVDDLGIRVIEELNTGLEGSNIAQMELTKTIILPEKYLEDDKYLDSIQFSIEKSYEYLGDNKVEFSKLADRLIVKVSVDDGETLILNNIEFLDVDGLQIKIDSNTKSSDVVTLKVGDNYTEGELKTRMKNNGYVCS